MLAARFVGRDFLEALHHLVRIEAELLVDRRHLVRRDQVEEQRLEAVRGPVLDDLVLFLRELRDGAVGPNLPELVVERFVGHDELRQLLRQRIVPFFEDRSEGAHGEAFDQHLHADDLLIDLRRVHDFLQQAG